MEGMKRVLVVRSVHQEIGKATARELYWLLNRLRPNVLFLECSQADFPAFLDGSYGTLESAVVMHYRRHNEVILVPVDLHLPDAKLLKLGLDEMLDRIEVESLRYCQLDSTNCQYTAEGGFAYLNSPLNAQLESEIQREMRASVDAVGDSKLTELHALWARTNDLRELEMISRVEAFANHTSFKKGVLLVGAAHQPSLLEKSQLLHSDETNVVVWDFDWRLEEAISDGDVGPNGDSLDRGAR